jgi:CRP-like cAMP-binding protein
MPKVKNIEFFKQQEVESRNLHDVCEWLSYRYCKEGEVIYHFGDLGDSMYIILDGEVNFTLNMAHHLLVSG